MRNQNLRKSMREGRQGRKLTGVRWTEIGEEISIVFQVMETINGSIHTIDVFKVEVSDDVWIGFSLDVSMKEESCANAN